VRGVSTVHGATARGLHVIERSGTLSDFVISVQASKSMAARPRGVALRLLGAVVVVRVRSAASPTIDIVIPGGGRGDDAAGGNTT